jgi:predicted dehydrogenase/threonine dehydrogenase-like Zn-dependent dehydrogenase
MKQAVLRAGAPNVVEVPAPSPSVGRALVANLASVISSGTERTAVSSGGGGGTLPVRAVRNPDLVKRAIEHMREHGVRETLDLARGVAAPDVALGYSCAGVVLDTGAIAELRVGQLVACAGAGHATHAEVVSVPANLVAAVPSGVDVRDAAFTTLGAIALQGVRRAQLTLGERVAVVGLGLLGLLAVQLVRACGCPAIGVEPQASRRELAVSLGAERALEPEQAADAVAQWTEGIGVDAVLVAAASPSDGIVNQAIAMLRRKGRVVPVGDVGLGIERAPLYSREADILISTSYGPGRYDASYEEAGLDYPLPYVRWTENRNMGEFLRLLAAGQVQVKPLIELERPLERAGDAYAAIAGDAPPLAAVLTYDAEATRARVQGGPELVRAGAPAKAGVTGRGNGRIRIALIGAGGFVTGVHLPNIKSDASAEVALVVNRSGTSASDAARLAGGADTATDWRLAIERDDVDLVLIGTRHDSHAEIAAAALRAGKTVFVEKPLGLSREEIDAVWRAGAENDRLAIGFNRPFSPLARALERELRDAGAGPVADAAPMTSAAPVALVYRVCSPLPAEHWLNDPAVGGGRILGEACHMFDFANWLCGRPLRVYGAALPARPGMATVETSSVTIEYANGSVATVHYAGVGAPSMPKERIEVMVAGRSWVLDDFKTLTSFDSRGDRAEAQRKVDKGHAALMAAVLGACRGRQPFEPGLMAAYAAQSVALCALEAIASGQAVEVPLPSQDRR